MCGMSCIVTGVPLDRAVTRTGLVPLMTLHIANTYKNSWCYASCFTFYNSVFGAFSIHSSIDKGIAFSGVYVSTFGNISM